MTQFGPANVLSLSRPRAPTLPQRDAQRRAETSGGSRGPANGTRSAAARELGGSLFRQDFDINLHGMVVVIASLLSLPVVPEGAAVPVPVAG